VRNKVNKTFPPAAAKNEKSKLKRAILCRAYGAAHGCFWHPRPYGRG
jgi:hypothetical protein